MSMKKALLLVSMALGLVAFAAPAAAHAELQWYQDPGNEPVAEPVEGVETEGTLATVSAWGLVTGPELVQPQLLIENTEEGGGGRVEAFTVNTPEGGIPTNVPGCVAAVPFAKAGRIDLTAPDVVAIDEAEITFHYVGESCQAVGVPESITVEGTMIGKVNPEDHHCIEFNEEDEMVTDFWMPWTFGGQICVSGYTIH